MAEQVKEQVEKEFEERVVTINRITKVVKGGRRMRFAALVVVGDYKGHVGFGTGKAAEVPEAIKKALADAKKNIIKFLSLAQQSLMISLVYMMLVKYYLNLHLLVLVSLLVDLFVTL